MWSRGEGSPRAGVGVVCEGRVAVAARVEVEEEERLEAGGAAEGAGDGEAPRG